MESFHRTLKKILRDYALERSKKWSTLLPSAVIIVNTKKNESGYSPFELLFGAVCSMPMMREKAIQGLDLQKRLETLSRLSSHRVYLIEEKNYRCEQRNRSAEDLKEKFHRGRQVLLLKPPAALGKKLETYYDGPFLVSRPGNLGTTYIRDRIGLFQTLLNNDRLKRYFKREGGECYRNIYKTSYKE